MQYLGKDSEEAIAPADAWSEDQFVQVELESEASNEDGIITTPSVSEVDDDSDVDLQFFDTVQSQSPPLLGGSEPWDITVTTPPDYALRLIDTVCPCWIEMCDKKGRYCTVYAFQAKEGARALFRTCAICSEYLGDRQMTEVDDRFSHRMSSEERIRRVLGLRFAEARAGKASPTRLLQFINMKTHFDKKFLQREPSSSKAKVSTVKSGFVARALSDRHWVEEFCQITESFITFCHAEKSKTSFRVRLKCVVNVTRMPKNQCPLLSLYHFMTIETFGRTINLMFYSETDRNSWVDSILQLILRQKPTMQSTSMNSGPTHLIDVDNPLEEFLHKSSMWDCQRRRILNCRRFSFRTPDSNDQPDPLALVEEALRRATSFRPNGPDDNDLRGFLDCVAALKEADADHLSEKERLPFFINLYHVMILHAFLVVGPPDSTLKWISYFNVIAYQCSDDIFSLTELEHNIIRSGMTYPSQFLSRFILPKSQFRFALAKPDFRINFALNCGSLSIPSSSVPIYKPELIEEQLDFVSSAFLDGTVTINQKTVTMPTLLKWFANDFGEGSISDIINLIEPLLSEEKRRTLKGQYWSSREGRYELGIWNVRYTPFSFECRYFTLDTRECKNT
jgi:hypothetical protein